MGLGKNGFIKAGHAAFVLIENSTGLAEYYDFGRYVTPKGKARVRSAVTDVELEIPFKATFSPQGKLANIGEFLIWLEAHPEKTHGNGRLVASVCDYIYYDRAKSFVLEQQRKGDIPYATFGKKGSNCSRIVTDTLLAGTDVPKIRKALLRNKTFTPSPLGNVEKSSMENKVYQVKEGVLEEYSRSVVKENLTNYFDKKGLPTKKAEEDFRVPDFLKKAHFLPGIGSGAYFTLKEAAQKGLFEIRRYTIRGKEDFRGIFEPKAPFYLTKEHKFTYGSNCKHCYIEQEGTTVIRFDLVYKAS